MAAQKEDSELVNHSQLHDQGIRIFIGLFWELYCQWTSKQDAWPKAGFFCFVFFL